LAERRLVEVSGAQVGGGEYLREPGKPAPEERDDRAQTEPAAQPLQEHGIFAGAEPVVQRGIPGPCRGELPLGPLVPVQPDPDREGRIAVDLPERRAPLRIPQVKIEVVDEGHLPAPLLQNPAPAVTPLARPGPPCRGLLLPGADQDNLAVAARSGRLQVRARNLLPVITLGEADHRDAVLL